MWQHLPSWSFWCFIIFFNVASFILLSFNSFAVMYSNILMRLYFTIFVFVCGRRGKRLFNFLYKHILTGRYSGCSFAIMYDAWVFVPIIEWREENDRNRKYMKKTSRNARYTVALNLRCDENCLLMLFLWSTTPQRSGASSYFLYFTISWRW